MTLQSSGAISLANVKTELGGSGIITLNDASVRSLAGKPSGVISLADLYGKSKTVTPSLAFDSTSNFVMYDNNTAYDYMYAGIDLVFNEDGTITKSFFSYENSPPTPGKYLSPIVANAGASFSIKVSNFGVNMSTGTETYAFVEWNTSKIIPFDTWNTLSSGAALYVYTKYGAFMGSISISGTVSIKNNSTGYTISRTFNLTAED